MFEKEVTLTNEVGLHTRPATYFTQKASEFSSTIMIQKDSATVNAKSLLGILALGVVKGTTIKIIANGTDEDQAVNSLVHLIESDFAEE